VGIFWKSGRQPPAGEAKTQEFFRETHRQATASRSCAVITSRIAAWHSYAAWKSSIVEKTAINDYGSV
jgi:hypothetical protein